MDPFQLTVDLSQFLPPPQLRTEAFTLRPFVDADLGAVAEAATDPHIPLMTTVPTPFTDVAGREYIARQQQRLRTDLGYSLAIADADTDRAVGQIGLWLRNVDKGRASLGYWVIPSARGRGAARQALSALTGWALDVLHVPRLEVYVEPWNTASIRTASGAGFHAEGVMRSWEEVGGARRDMIMFSRLAADVWSCR